MSDFIEENKARYDLWKFFSEEHGLMLTEGQIEDILAAVEVYKTKISEANEANKQPPTKALPLHGVSFSETDKLKRIGTFCEKCRDVVCKCKETSEAEVCINIVA